MSIGHALKFIHSFEADQELRKECNSCKSFPELLELLKSRDIYFTPQEFEEAINGLLVKCQSYEQADYVNEIMMWFKMFMIERSN
ncbi:Nif11-like leader peptide family natural product precursor [Natronoflexus pectinivorans]|uniref:Nif11 domain-containing protein n=1 Tax=Natronoflexus pectinivorans TaxID=682526 RepID=A0A4R2GFX0_9BACT|nr:Nif11-like leader peptide family natural product precursor [Natronoflexus pectinivorans]TCO07120.1 hypothetical protein EV194_110123 [Natronoflexus pectinivorans]